jgi:hypothetical protein
VRTIATIFALAAALWAVQAGAALLFHRRRVRGYLDEAHPGRDARLFHRLRTLPGARRLPVSPPAARVDAYRQGCVPCASMVALLKK